MVADTEIQTSGWCSRTSAATVPLPTAVRAGEDEPRRGPSGPRRRVSHAGGELALERGDLLGAQAAHPAALGDAEPLHQLPGADLAEPGIDCSRSMTRILPMTSLRWPSLEDVDDRGAGVLEPVLDLGPLPAGGGGLVEGRLALFGGERGQSHVLQVLLSESSGERSARSI